MKSGLGIGTVATLDLTVSGSQVIHLGADQAQGAIVFATPSMINLMEHAARRVLQPFLEAGEDSVGVRVNVEHLAATPIAARVRAEAKVTAIQKRLIDFEILAFDEQEQIGRGTHQRAVVSLDRFVAKLADKIGAAAALSAVPQTAPVPTPAPGGLLVPASLLPNTQELPPLQTVRVERDRSICVVTLNRPQKLNAVNRQMTEELEQVNAWLAGHNDIRVVIVTGAGDAFCAGDDVKEVGTLDLEEARRLSHRQAQLYLAWERLPQVFVAAVNGVAFGAGCVCACACDFRLATHAARFSMPEVKLGWPPGYGLAQLTAIVGKPRALEMCLTCREVSAAEALPFGLVHDVVPQARLTSSSRQLADQLLALPADAIRRTKQLLHADEGPQSKLAFLNDTAAYIDCLGAQDAREGIDAFVSKRVPMFGQP